MGVRVQSRCLPDSLTPPQPPSPPRGQGRDALQQTSGALPKGSRPDALKFRAQRAHTVWDHVVLKG